MRNYEILWYTKDGEISSTYYKAENQKNALARWRVDFGHFLSLGTINEPFFVEEVINHPFMKQYIDISMVDNTQWRVPLYFVVRSHASANKEKFDGEIGRSILEGTIPYFERNSQHIINWVKTGMSYDQLLNDAINITQKFDNEHLVASSKLIQAPYAWGWGADQ